MEAINYAKDRRKPIITIFVEATFRPYGALGAITASAIKSIVLKDDGAFVHAVSEITYTARTQIIKSTNTVNAKEPLQVKMVYHDR
jgi:hypothetical protein